MASGRALRILLDFYLPAGTIRVWDGSGGPFIDPDGNVYRACQLADGALQSIQTAMNSEAYSLSLSLIGVDETMANKAWEDDENETVIGSKVVIKIQYLTDRGQPIGDPDVKFTGRINDLSFSDEASDDGIKSTITVDIANRFTLLTLTSGVVLSDVDQRARSKKLNPTQTADDRFCERVPIMRDKTVKWPKW
ncbi:hypothetical protein [Neorhizobium sp. NCHU2750]|uniref:hypothetical protein n=1 Tax=Neorhizobium sp. NCHU2750 TaxID=1825976 RepID=UPI000E767D89|nr:hypothetical protein NCHU2750_06340 [Neorhizobium sp. NCHU2750]